MNILIILNDPPYGTERSYNGLRAAKALISADADTNVTVFLLADSVLCAKAGQKVPRGLYNLELMLKSVIRNGEVMICGICMDERGLKDEEMVEGSKHSTMKDLADKTLQADKVLVF